MNPRSGVIAGGNWIVDHVKLVDAWPAQDALATIRGESRGNGGSPYNILKNLAKLGAKISLEGVGLVGADDLGRWVRADCLNHGIDVRQLQEFPAAPTSYTDVITVQSTGRRTFFHQRGANALLKPAHFDFSRTRAKIFHLGYLLLLDALDAAGEDGAPRSRQVLAAARQTGLRTSIDLVSETADRFQQTVIPVLPEVDYCFLNDYEVTRLSGIEVRQATTIDPVAVARVAQRLLDKGIREWVIIHFPEGCYARGRDGSGHWQAGLKISPDKIKGAAGAGDAFAAGVLLGLHEEWPMPQSLKLGVAAGASALFSVTCSDSVLSVKDCLELAHETGFQALVTG